MPAYRYLAIAPGGGVVRGRLEAADRVAALAALDRLGLEARTLGEGAGATLSAFLSADLGGSRVPAAALTAFTREMALLLRARIGLAPALAMLVADGGREFARLPLADLLRRVEDGASLSDAMAAHPAVFAPDYLGIVRVGQASGALADAVTDLARILEQRAAARGRIAGALAYPAILLAASIGTVAVLVTLVLPSFAPLFQRAGIELPWTTRLVLAAADRAPAIGMTLALIAGLAFVAWVAGGRTVARRTARDRAMLRLPLIGPLLMLDGLTKALRALGIMVKGGLLLRPALAIAAGGARNAAMAALLIDLGASLERGERLSDGLRQEPGVPAVVPRLVRVGEEGGDLAASLLHLAELLDAKLQQRLQRATALIAPILTMLIGGLIALVLIAVMSALLGANELALG